MSRKLTLVHTLISDQSLSAGFTTPPTVVRYLDNCSYQIIVTTTDSVGTFAVQASNDYYVNEGNSNVVQNPGTWNDLTLAGGTPFVNHTNDTIMVNLNQLPFYAIRLIYRSTTAGTGTCSIYVVDKTVGA